MAEMTHTWLWEWQTWAVIAVALAIVIGSIGSAARGGNACFDFGCKVHWLSKHCK